MAFAVEAVPPESNLFRRITREHVVDAKTGKISSAAFRHERMSVNWERYSNAESSADENCVAVVAIVADACMSLGQTVEHTPIQMGEPFGPNQAHCEVCGKKTKAISQQLRDLARMVWRRPE